MFSATAWMCYARDVSIVRVLSASRNRGNRRGTSFYFSIYSVVCGDVTYFRDNVVSASDCPRRPGDTTVACETTPPARAAFNGNSTRPQTFVSQTYRVCKDYTMKRIKTENHSRYIYPAGENPQNDCVIPI